MDKRKLADTTAWQTNPGTPYNQGLYPGDTDGDIFKESMPLENLVNGNSYYALVKTVGADGRESKISNIVSFRPLARGEFILSSNQLADDGGFNFENQQQVPGRDPRSDVYLYATETKVGLSAPSRLGMGLRKTSFRKSGNESFETIQIKSGDKLLLKTKSGEVDIDVLSLNGRYPDITVRIGYIFYPGSR